MQERKLVSIFFYFLAAEKNLKKRKQTLPPFLPCQVPLYIFPQKMETKKCDVMCAFFLNEMHRQDFSLGKEWRQKICIFWGNQKEKREKLKIKWNGLFLFNSIKLNACTRDTKRDYMFIRLVALKWRNTHNLII